MTVDYVVYYSGMFGLSIFVILSYQWSGAKLGIFLIAALGLVAPPILLTKYITNCNWPCEQDPLKANSPEALDEVILTAIVAFLAMPTAMLWKISPTYFKCCRYDIISASIVSAIMLNGIIAQRDIDQWRITVLEVAVAILILTLFLRTYKRRTWGVNRFGVPKVNFASTCWVIAMELTHVCVSMGLHRDWTGVVSAACGIGGGLLLCLFDGTTRLRDWHMFWFPAWAISLATCLSLRAAVYLSELDERAIDSRMWQTNIEDWQIVEHMAVVTIVLAVIDAVFACREPTNPITTASFPEDGHQRLKLPPEAGGKLSRYGSLSSLKWRRSHGDMSVNHVYGRRGTGNATGTLEGTDASGRPVYLTQSSDHQHGSRPMFNTQHSSGRDDQYYPELNDEELFDEYGRPVNSRAGADAL